MSNDLVPINEIKEMAVQAIKSGLFPMPNESAAFTLMMVCQSEGLHPIQALKRYHIIKGRPSMRADAMLAEFQRLGGKVEWLERTDKVCSAVFTHEQGGKVPVEWNIEMAKQAGLTGNNTWKQYPRQMLTARVVSEGVRTCLPGVVTGIYTPEEIYDFDTPAPRQAQKTSKKTEKPVEKPAEKPTEKPTEKPKTEQKNTENIEDAQIVGQKTQSTLEKNLAEKCGFDGAKQQEPESTPEPKATASAGEIAEERKKIRAMAQAYGCKSGEDFSQLMAVILKKKITAVTSLSADERQDVSDWLTLALKEQKEQEQNNG